MMKKIFVILLCIAMLLSIAACGKKTEAAAASAEKEVTAETSAEPETEEAAQQPAEPAFDPMTVYDQVISDYCKAINERMLGKTLAEANMSTDIIFLYAEDEPLTKIGYFMHDMDSDGIDELFIGPVDDSDESKKGMVYHMFTIDTEKQTYKDLFVSSDTDKIFLCDDYSLVLYMTPDETTGEYMKYSVSDGQFKMTDGLLMQVTQVLDFMTKQFNSVTSWTKISGGDDHESTTLTDDEAMDYIAELCSSYMEIPYTPLSEYKSA